MTADLLCPPAFYVYGCIRNCILPNYSRQKTVCDKRSMFKFTVLIEEYAKSTTSSMILIWWALYYPMYITKDLLLLPFNGNLKLMRLHKPTVIPECCCFTSVLQICNCLAVTFIHFRSLPNADSHQGPFYYFFRVQFLFDSESIYKKVLLPSQSSVADWSYGTNDNKDNGVNGTGIIDYEMQGEIVMMALNRAIMPH